MEGRSQRENSFTGLQGFSHKEAKEYVEGGLSPERRQQIRDELEQFPQGVTAQLVRDASMGLRRRIHLEVIAAPMQTTITLPERVNITAFNHSSLVPYPYDASHSGIGQPTAQDTPGGAGAPIRNSAERTE